jgi:hypothetical protein
VQDLHVLKTFDASCSRSIRKGQWVLLNGVSMTHIGVFFSFIRARLCKVEADQFGSP